MSARRKPLPCPFCGDKPAVFGGVISCESSPFCGVEPRVVGANAAHAAELWNRNRPKDTALLRQIRARKVLERALVDVVNAPLGDGPGHMPTLGQNAKRETVARDALKEARAILRGKEK